MTTSASALQLTLGIIKPSVAAHQPHVQGEKPGPFVHLGEAVRGSGGRRIRFAGLGLMRYMLPQIS